MGRPPVPTKLTPARTKQLSKLIAAGMSLEAASYACDITPQTFFGWMRKGREQPSGIYYDFFLAIKKAQAFCEAKCLEQLKIDPRWPRWAWLLERKFPDRWGRREPRERPPKAEPPMMSMDEAAQTARDVLAQMGYYDEESSD
jgi:hypothetical protein